MFSKFQKQKREVFSKVSCRGRQGVDSVCFLRRSRVMPHNDVFSIAQNSTKSMNKTALERLRASNNIPTCCRQWSLDDPGLGANIKEFEE